MNAMSSSTRLARVLSAGGAVLLVNSAYLAAFATPSLFYYTNVAFHVLLGGALLLGGVVFLVGRWRTLTAAEAFAAALLSTGGLLGVVLSITGATTPHRRLLLAHIVVASAGGVLAAALFAAARLRRAGRSNPLPVMYAALALCAVGGPLSIALWARGTDVAGRIVNPPAPLRMEDEGGGVTSPFFPSSANTNVNRTIPANFFMTSETCGRCHKDIYDQWNSSTHHFSSFNNQWYRKSIEYMQDVVGTKPSQMVRRLPRSRGVLQRPLRPADQGADRHAGGAGGAGVHLVPLDLARAEHDGPGRLRDRVPAAARSGGEREPAAAGGARSRSCYLDPRAASRDVPQAVPPRADRRSSARRATRSTSTCRSTATAGSAASTTTTTGRRRASRAQGARSFYYPPKPQKCADCHMPLVESNDPAAKNGMVRSHRFPAANTAMPFVNGDTEQLKATQAFLQGRRGLGGHLRPRPRRGAASAATTPRPAQPAASRESRARSRSARSR